MAKRKNIPPITEPTELIISKQEFNRVLEERIPKGKELLERNITTQAELDKLKKDFDSWTDYNSEFLKQSFNNPHNEYKREYEDSGYSFLGNMSGSDNPIVQQQYVLRKKVEELEKLISKASLLKSSLPNSSVEPTQRKNLAMDEVFIVHGHDEEAKEKTARFVEKLGFKPIILHEKASSGKTIIEKIESYSYVGFGIVLYTACDIGGKKTENPDLRNRGRQNVVFEHGFLIGKIGRPNVTALVKEDIETPNDISGVVYVFMDDAGSWQFQIAKELQNSGYQVDLNKLL